jgi:hypothetical protein
MPMMIQTKNKPRGKLPPEKRFMEHLSTGRNHESKLEGRVPTSARLKD